MTEMKEEIKQDPLNTKEVNEAAYMFQTTMKQIKQLIPKLSLRGSNRLLVALLEYPYNTNSNLSKIEQEIFLNAMVIGQSKLTMNEALRLSKEEMESKVINPITEGEQNG